MTDSGYDAGENHSEVDTPWELRNVVRVLVRRRTIALGMVVLCLAAGTLITVRSPRIYEGKAVLLIDRNAPRVLTNVNDVFALGGSYNEGKEFYKTQYAVLASRPVAQKVVVALGLSVPDLIAGILRSERTAGPGSNPLDGLSYEVRKKIEMLGLHKSSDRNQIIEELRKLDIVAFVQEKIQVNPVTGSKVVEIVIQDTDPDRAALFANTVVDSYIELNLDQKIDATGAAAVWLTDQLIDLKKRLEDSERKLHDFKKSNNIISVSLKDRQSIIAQTLSELNGSLSATSASRMALESRLEQVRGNAVDDVTEVIGNQLIQALKTNFSNLKQNESELTLRYTKEHPKLIGVRRKLDLVSATLEAEINKVASSIEKQYEAAAETEMRLTRAIDEVKAEALALNRKEIDYTRMEREAENNEELYSLVLRRQKEADLTRMLKVNNVRKLESAIPPSWPSRPQVLANMALALAIGLILGVLSAMLVDVLDSSVKTQEHVERLGLPFLGMIPAIKVAKSAADAGPHERDRFVIEHPRSTVAECCRTIRTNLLFMFAQRPARTMLITSSGPREGKSTTAINLALTMAQSGAKTVIVDTDLRRPRVHKSFDLSADIGITNVLLGERALKEVIRPSPSDDLHVLASGPIPPNPAELFHTKQFAAIIEELTELYDRVIFDSPPVNVVTDGVVLASMVDGVVLVVQTGETSLHAALEAKRRLLDVGARIFGVTLNHVDLESKSYGDYYHYYYYYGSGYTEDEKVDAARA